MNTRSAATLVLAGLVLAGCSAGLGPEGDRVNARSYYDDYQEAEADGANNYSVGAAAPSATGQAAGAASPHPADAGKRYGWPGVTDDNTFTDEGSSRWTPVRTRPQSTFALDVDTGSYQVARTFLRDGYRPPAESIRVEEWINAFDYGDPAPIGKDAVRVGAESGVSPYGAPGTALVRIGVSTRTATTAQGPTHVTFVVDTSGSMDIRERLGLVQSSLALLVNNLEPEDTIAIVEYGSEARRVLPPTKVRDSDRIVAATTSCARVAAPIWRPDSSSAIDRPRRHTTPTASMPSSSPPTAWRMSVSQNRARSRTRSSRPARKGSIS
ncbi:putative secreted protein (fragment) [Nostocoides australiense Ben110]|uniref:Putative secreted protein n=1 Tax=Nostocoides australiense Ben110 TaxID=1193182 RepID=W6K1T1_9MICO